MDTFQAVFLAFVQGFTEFLPISSSAHLILPSQVFGWPDQGLAYDVAVHVGSLIAVIFYFRKDVKNLAIAWFGHVLKGKKTDESQMAWFVIVATIPAGLAGLLFNDFIEANLRSMGVIAATTIGFGLLLWLADVNANKQNFGGKVDWKSVMVVAFAQALALIPGTSRSGITMTAALLMGWKREVAAKFSFLLSIPLILAAGSLKTLELAEHADDVPWGDIVLGTLVSGVTAYACIFLFLKFIERMGFMPFVIYRIVLGCFLCTLIYYSNGG